MHHKIPERASDNISKSDSDRVMHVCELLQLAENITDSRSGSTCVTLIISSMEFNLLMKWCQKATDKKDEEFQFIVQRLLWKLEYEALFCC